MHRDADGAGLIRDGAGDGLANPPGGIGRELVAALILELVHGLDQTDVAFLDQIEKLQATVGVLFGDGDDQTQVGPNQLLLGPLGRVVAALDAPQHLFQLVDIVAALVLQAVENLHLGREHFLKGKKLFHGQAKGFGRNHGIDRARVELGEHLLNLGVGFPDRKDVG